MSADNYRFAESDSLLCYHGPMLYEAKCLQRRKSNEGKAQYYIHYKGWNSKWEEWVDDDRVLAVNNVNMHKMAALKELHSNSKKGVSKRSVTVVIKEDTIRNPTPAKGRKRKYSEISSELIQSLNISTSSEPKLKKRGRPPKVTIISKTDSTDPIEAVQIEPSEIVEDYEKILETNVNKTIDAHEEPETIKTESSGEETENNVFIAPAPVNKIIPVINIPLILKKRIIYDKYMTTQNNKILKFPKKITVEKVIRAFICSRVKKYERALSIGLTLMQYFNLIIHKKLLYPSERLYKLKHKATDRLEERLMKKSVKRFHFGEVLFPKKMWHYVYGPTYLLRLFIHLPKFLTGYFYTEQQLALFIKVFEQFLKFLESNFDKYFTNEEYLDVNDKVNA